MQGATSHRCSSLNAFTKVASSYSSSTVCSSGATGDEGRTASRYSATSARRDAVMTARTPAAPRPRLLVRRPAMHLASAARRRRGCRARGGGGGAERAGPRFGAQLRGGGGPVPRRRRGTPSVCRGGREAAAGSKRGRETTAGRRE